MAKENNLKEIALEKLYVNPDNARFINAQELPDEVSAIRELTSMHTAHILKLAKDISINGLNPNELPIVIPNKSGKYLVIDGNRRITSIKLMTQYKKNLNKIGLNAGQKKVFSDLNCTIKNVLCVIYEDENKVNLLLEKIHTSKPGIGKVNWDPQAQERHQFKCGNLSRRLAVIELLKYSSFTDDTAKRILRKQGWTSKLLRFVRNDQYMLTFGLSFDTTNNVYLLYEEPEVIQALCQLVFDLDETVASDIAQTEKVRDAYINSFPVEKKPNREKMLDKLILFNVEKKRFESTNIENELKKTIDDTSIGDQEQTGENNGKKPEQGNNQSSPAGTQHLGSISAGTSGSSNGGSSNGNKDSDYKSTDERATLIPKDENIPIKNQRTLDLYDELKYIPVGKYTNAVSIAFRSLLEFSINYFLDSRKNSWAYNEQISLFQKLEKVIAILESIYPKDQLENELHAIYRSIVTFNTQGKKCDLNSIPHLHVLIHSYTYHPIDKELKILYNNYSPLLRLIWESTPTNN